MDYRQILDEIAGLEGLDQELYISQLRTEMNGRIESLEGQMTETTEIEGFSFEESTENPHGLDTFRLLTIYSMVEDASQVSDTRAFADEIMDIHGQLQESYSPGSEQYLEQLVEENFYTTLQEL